MLRAVVLLLACAVLAAGATACGSAGSSAAGDPASLVPPGAPVYVELTLRPQGARRDEALAAAGKLLRSSDPAARLQALFDEALAKGHGRGLSWERDFAPWLGEKAGVWLTGLERDEPSWAAVIASTDQTAAGAALARIERAGGGTRTKRSYGGVSYTVDREGVAVGQTGDWVVVGSEDAFKRTLDARDGDTLRGSSRYRHAIDGLRDDRLGHFYVDPKPLLAAAVRRDPAAAQQYAQVKGLLALDDIGPVSGAFSANGDGMAVDTLASKLPDGPLRRLAGLGSGGGGDMLASLPGDAWGALASSKVGSSFQALLASFGGFGAAAVSAQVEQATGLDLERDVLSWMGDLGLFVRGTRASAVDGALVITSTDDDKAAAGFAKLVGALVRETGTAARPVRVAGAESAFSLAFHDGDEPVILARGKGRVVAAYGEAAARDALQPSRKLGDSADYDAARGILGDGLEPSFLLSVPATLLLAQASGETDAHFDRAREYLDTLGVVTGGGKADGDHPRSRVAVTFR